MVGRPRTECDEIERYNIYIDRNYLGSGATIQAFLIRAQSH